MNGVGNLELLELLETPTSIVSFLDLPRELRDKIYTEALLNLSKSDSYKDNEDLFKEMRVNGSFVSRYPLHYRQKLASFTALIHSCTHTRGLFSLQVAKLARKRSSLSSLQSRLGFW